MKLHIIRHAQARERSADLPEEQRYLTCRGRKRFRQVAACLKKLTITPDYIIASPLVRAVQTAEILTETIRYNGEVQISAELAGGPDIAALTSLLKAKSSAREIVIVGHEPALGALVGTLLHLPTPCVLAKGDVISLEIALKKTGLIATLISLITGSGKAILAPANAIKRLLGETHSENEGDTTMRLTARELKKIKGIGDVLAVRLLEAGHDSFAKIVKLGESGLKEIKGINPKAILDILEQAARLSEKKSGSRDERVVALKGSLHGLLQSVQELTRAAKDRFSEKLAGKTGEKLTRSLLQFIEAVEELEDKAGKKVKRSRKAVMKAEQQLEGLAAAGLKEFRTGLKRARKALQKVHG